MSEREPRKTFIFKVVMAISERGAPPGQCVDVGYVLSYDRDFVKILRAPRPGFEGRETEEGRSEEVLYGRSSVRVVSLENEILSKRAAQEGRGKIVPLIRRHKQIGIPKVSLGDGTPRSVHSAENP